MKIYRLLKICKTLRLSSLAVIFLSTGCSSINIDAAKALSETGRGVAVQTQQNIFVSDSEFLHTRDSEAFFHGYSGTTSDKTYIGNLGLLNDIHQELAKRTVVFENLSSVYESFGDLTGLDASKDTEAALGNLGGAINEYATAVKAPQPISSNNTSAISKIGGLIAEEIQKAKIKEASKQIRENLVAFHKLLDNKLVREQFGFKAFAASDRKSAVTLLLKEGLFDRTPLLNELGAEFSLTAQNDATNLINSKPKVANGFDEIYDKRLAGKNNAIEQAYNASVTSSTTL